MIFRIILISFIIFLHPYTSISQDSTSSISIFSKEVIIKAEKLIDNIGYTNGRLKITSAPNLGYTTESGWEFGFSTNTSISPKDSSIYYRPSHISSYFSYSTKHWLRSRLNVKAYVFSKYSLKIVSRYMNTPDRFWGVGNNYKADEFSNFTISNFEFNITLGRGFFHKYFLGVITDISSVETLSVSGDNLNDVIGANGGNSFGFGMFTLFDSRNNTNYPSKGQVFELEMVLNPDMSFNDYFFSRYSFKTSSFHKLFSNLIVGLNSNLSGSIGDIPFYKMPQFGGNSYLRGISGRYKYIDKNCYYFQSELRKDLWWRFGAVIFAGVGNTFNDYKENIFSSMKWVGGVGGRYAIMPKDKLNFRIDVGIGSNRDFGLYLSVGEAF